MATVVYDRHRATATVAHADNNLISGTLLIRNCKKYACTRQVSDPHQLAHPGRATAVVAAKMRQMLEYRLWRPSPNHDTARDHASRNLGTNVRSLVILVFSAWYA